MDKAIHIGSTVGEQPATCDHCGGETESIGLVAPICKVCGKFSMSHIQFGEPQEVEVDLKLIIE